MPTATLATSTLAPLTLPVLEACTWLAATLQLQAAPSLAPALAASTPMARYNISFILD